jgi:hypothetical protein
MRPGRPLLDHAGRRTAAKQSAAPLLLTRPKETQERTRLHDDP